MSRLTRAPRTRGAAPTVEECRGAAEILGFLHDLLRLPSPAQWAWLASPATRRAQTGLWRGAGLPAPPPLPGDRQEYECQFIAAFEAGRPHPAVPLVESHYNRRAPIPKILHENILFHRAFGLILRPSAAESADHLRHQLEFLAWLWILEGRERREGAEDARLGQIARARADFEERHLRSWIPQAAGEARKTSWPWVRSLVEGVSALTVLRTACPS